MRDHGLIEQPEPLSVVIIDDHVMFAEGLATSLRATGQVEVAAIAPTADTGEAAVALDRPHVVLLDYGLPDDDGVALARRLHQRFPDIKLVMVTSLVDERLALRAVEAGCAGFVTKDHTTDELVAAIRTVADGEAIISPAVLNKVLRQIPQRSESAVGADLSARELEVLRYVCNGLTNPAIAELLDVSHNTVRSHVQNILTKLKVHSKLEAAAVATRHGIVELA